MATGSNQNADDGDQSSSGATQPLTLTDPDGAITLIAPWSTWTREQVRAPGGQPSMVTRLDQGQVWFSSGRSRSPWRHEVKVGAVSVTTRDGRFHVTAEPDGGATVDCLVGTTMVSAGLQAPVVLTADQTAAVASDGATLVVLDGAGRGAASEDVADGALDLTDAGTVAGAGAVVDAGDSVAAGGSVAAGDGGATGETNDGERELDGGATVEPAPAPAGVGGVTRERATRLPEVVAVAALLAVLVAAVIVFGRQPDYESVEVAQTVGTTTEVPRTTERPSSSTSTTTSTTSTTSTTLPTTTVTSTSPRALTNPAQATGLLAACKRAEGGVVATINVRMRSGGPGQFKVGVGLVGTDGQVFATGEARTEVIEQGGSAPVDVMVPVAGPARGACELLGVEAV